jgi:hypothetical protein
MPSIDSSAGPSSRAVSNKHVQPDELMADEACKQINATRLLKQQMRAELSL